MLIPRLLVLLLAVSLSACAGSAKESSADQLGVARHILAREEIQRVSPPNAYEAVVMLRNGWLSHSRRPSVAVDDILVGGVDELRRIRTLHVERMQFLDVYEASLRFGQRGIGPVILVTLARAEPS